MKVRTVERERPKRIAERTGKITPCAKKKIVIPMIRGTLSKILRGTATFKIIALCLSDIFSRECYQYKENVHYPLTSEFVQTKCMYSIPSLNSYMDALHGR